MLLLSDRHSITGVGELEPAEVGVPDTIDRLTPECCGGGIGHRVDDDHTDVGTELPARFGGRSVGTHVAINLHGHAARTEEEVVSVAILR